MTRREVILGGAALLGGFALGKPTRGAVGAAGASQKSAASWGNPYITDGLVAHWDGEWNAGGGVHDANATTWKDLVGNIDVVATPNVPQWTGNSFVGDHTTAFFADGTSLLPILATGKYSIEVCIGQSRLTLNSGGYFSIGNVGSGATATKGIYIKGNNKSNTAYDALINEVGYGRGSTMRGNQSFAVVANETSYANYINGAYTAKTTATCIFTPPNTNLYIGRYYYGRSQYDIHSVRLYSRALTEQEILANYAIDKARFGL